jgi:outer membrane protein OmpA-like peptidoglycan-associated protein
VQFESESKMKIFKNQLVLIFLIAVNFSCSSIIVPTSDFLLDAKIIPGKLKLERDSIRFTVKGNIPIVSAVSPQNPVLTLVLKSSETQLELGKVDLKKNVAGYQYQKDFVLAYQPWMEQSFLQINFFQGKRQNQIPFQQKVLARGVINTQLMAKIGEVFPDEPIPQIGIFIPTGEKEKDLSRIAEFSFTFDPGSSTLKRNAANQAVFRSMENFLNTNPTIASIKITGIQSPELVEGKNSKLGMDRANSAFEVIQQIASYIPKERIEVGARSNDWFDFRILLGEYQKISTQRKDQYYQILTSDRPYSEQAASLMKVQGFDQVSRDLFPPAQGSKN